MKLLVTGTGGQLGREWIHYLEQRKIDFTGYTSSGMDITQKANIDERLAADRPDVVINCAAYTRVDHAEEEPEKARSVNKYGAKILAECCRDHNIKLVHYSTDYVFPGYPSDRKLFPGGYPEEQPADPANVYGQSKWEGEQAVRQSGVDVLLIRVAWLCGPYGQNFVTKMLQKAKSHEVLNVVEDQWGSPTFTGNVVENTLLLLRRAATGTYHVNCNGVISWYDLAVEIFKQTNKNVSVRKVSSSEFATKAKRPSFSKLDTGKLQQLKGSRILHWKDGLKKLLEQLLR